MTEDPSPLRGIPSVSVCLETEPVRLLAAEFGAGAAKFELRALLEDLRGRIREGALARAPSVDEIAASLRTRLVRLSSPAGREAVNATGIILHTGLGRAPLCDEALEALRGMGGYSVLQVSVETGERSRRDEKVERLLRELTGCEAATVVNNNAAATMLVLHAMARGREVVVSRGQLIEIGGEFRMPDVMAESGCFLREVGTTNRTHLRDYEEAISERTGALLHVHTSNYSIRGFAGTPGIGEMCDLGRRKGVPVIDDLGSGALVPLKEYGLPDEPLVRDSITAGAEVVCFSGDKLVCGPQCGIVCGKAAAVSRIRKSPFARMFRVSKLELAALEATLIKFVNGRHRDLPLYKILGLSREELDQRAGVVARAVSEIPDARVEVEDDTSYIGSGSAPDQGIPTRVVAVRKTGVPAERLARALREGSPAVFARVRDDAVVLDVRTVAPRDEGAVETLARRLAEVLGGAG